MTFFARNSSGHLIDAEIDRADIGPDIVGELFLEHGIFRQPRDVRRVLQRLFADRGATDPKNPHEVGGLAAELGLLAGGKAHHLRVEFELLEGQFFRLQRPAGQPAGIDGLVELRRPAPGNPDATAVGIRSDAVDGIEIERQARGQDLAVLPETVGQAVDEAHLAAILVAAQRGEVAPVEPVDDTDQPEARRVRLQPAHVHDAADIAVGHLVEGAPAGFHLGPQRGDVGCHRLDDGVIGGRFLIERFQVVIAVHGENAGEAEALGIEGREDRRIVDDGHRLLSARAARHQ
ncbi:hypothetical protein [Mesorhizobium sp. M4B.F.Ca.ET.019.03.1.1]|uniref:hypothetical protein n=1 Tax=Mesorhizobium sp. M4B.F.Ca.ET.019.03.1.1 TaxID=2496651 RepID=UPI001FDF3405|nr:hypothetical protein [Mesorhizobium sp. M4B.F.Ca.ET.019.03.1.1]